MSTTASGPPGGATSNYIVALKRDVDMDTHLDWLRPKLSSRCEITHQYNLIHGFAGKFSEQTISLLRSSPDVEKIEKDFELDDDEET